MKALTIPFFFLFSFCAIPQNCACAVLTVKELQDKMEESSRSIESAQFKFIQEMKSSLSDEIKESSGTVIFKKPKFLKIEQRSPEHQIIVTSGKTVFIYTPRFNQVIKKDWNEWMEANFFFPGITQISGSLEKLKKDYDWSLENHSNALFKKEVRVRLKNKESKEGTEMLLTLDEKETILKKMEFFLNTFKVTTTLQEFEKNPNLKEKDFEFKPPKDAAVFQMD
ncbi:MAG: hypothetical protein A3I11_07500 [Elusimicrobia bacterium RIFCSPLOWO2_02_FULL_39_32]|nr:MAG: hypothetical protein A3B80_05125 [Elusimicrobia bacterium RIFCSPHIGHO2_02_FULL_39_36]OGR92030.1 MAG: hypothetical protein A3I11_07500 [Elusimicrobia bacterium RIFCSPLOWO2_02_FULL_39_32]OGZ59779.1 MAG: hypothetical protein A3E58_00230 [Candidatus Spechtbacteria bacterium RIFCSPHIGHO2_12_FULL_38_30]